MGVPACRCQYPTEAYGCPTEDGCPHLHPDLYEMAVLRRRQELQYGITGGRAEADAPGADLTPLSDQRWNLPELIQRFGVGEH